MSTTSGSISGYNKPVSGTVKRIDTKGCSGCESLKKLGSTRITCGICGKKH